VAGKLKQEEMVMFEELRILNTFQSLRQCGINVLGKEICTLLAQLPESGINQDG
jgi:GAF domain-containing protein